MIRDDWILKLLDLSQPFSVRTPPWPTYPPPVVSFIKRLAEQRVNAMQVTTPMHIGTHLDGQIHFVSNGNDIASIPLDQLYGEGVVVDISDRVGEYEIYEPKHVMEKADIKKGDILFVNTGFHKYAWNEPEADEASYFCKHPGPDKEFAEWCLQMKFKLLGVDCGSMDHPMNTIIRKVRPDLAEKAEKKLGKSLDSIFSNETYQLMHTMLFPKGILHVENLGGEIDKVLNKRVTLGVFPWKFQGGESAFCRVVAFLPD